METLSGVIATLDREMVFHKDLTDLATVRTELVELTVEYGELNHIELTVAGYDDDPRALYDVPEVNRWMRLARQHWPDLLFWLTPGSLWPVVLCLNPAMHKQQEDGRVRVEMDKRVVAKQAAASQLAALKLLSERGMTADALDLVVKRAQLNVMQLFERKKFGDYMVVHPKSGQPVNYRRDGF